MRSVCVFFALLGLAVSPAAAQAPSAGRNVNMVTVDPFLQKQNEPSIAVSTRNPCHMLAGANDYRTVNLPGLPSDQETGDSWVGLYKSIDCGQTWKAELVPGYPQDTTAIGKASPVYGFTTAADPNVRAGTAGSFFYSFIVFNRGTNNGKFAVARFVDRNDREAGDSFKYLGTTIIDSGSAGQFIDKPAIALGLGSGTCLIDGQTVQNTIVYSAWSVFVGNDNNIRSKLYFARSSNCGVSLDGPATKLSESFAINQGAAIAADPAGSNVYVVWRQFSPNNVLVAKSSDGGQTFTKGESIGSLSGLTFLEQATTSDRFRTNAYPSVVVDGTGTLHLFMSARVGPSGSAGVQDARIVHTSLARGATTWSAPQMVDPDTTSRGHQIMPAASLAGGKLNVIWYDLRDDVSGAHEAQIDERDASPYRHTLDVRGAQATLGSGQPPVFTTYGVLQLTGSERVSQYPLGNYKGANGIPQSGQLQFNRPNMRLYAGGTAPFIGDYIDVSGLTFVQDSANPQLWRWNLTDDRAGFAAAWTDNRDARDVGGNPDTVPYNAPGTIPVSSCTPATNAQAASRNANVYMSRIAAGIELIVPGNSKPATSLQRAFSIRIVNQTKDSRSVHLSLALVPAGVSASFDRSVARPEIDVNIGPRSSAARTIYLSSPSTPYPRIVVNGTSNDSGLPPLFASAVINRDAMNPQIQNPDASRASSEPIASAEIHNPDIQNPDIQNPDIQNPDIQNPDIQNPDIQNPDIQNPDIQNPDIQNPDVQNPDIQNPDVQNPDIQNPDIQNPDIQNPDIQNPDIQNPDIQNGSLTDATVAITNEGNTTSSYQVTSSVSGDTSPFVFQLIGSRIVRRPSAKDCQLSFVRENQILFNEPLPDLNTSFPDPNDPSEKNTTLQIAPGDTAYVTLRVYDPDPTDDIAFCPKGSTNPKCDPNNPTHTVTFETKAQAPNCRTTTGCDAEPAGDFSAPDFTIDGALAAGPTTIVSGDTISVTGATLRNAGNTAALVRGGVATDYLMSADNTITPEDFSVAKLSTLSLSPGQTVTLDRSIVTPTPFVEGDVLVDLLPPGNYFLGIYTDSTRTLAESNENNNASSVVPITVVPPPAITTASLPGGLVGTPYSATLSASGGVGALTWSFVAAPPGCEITCSALPPGLTFENGTLSGTPTEGGTFFLTVMVADSTPGAATTARHYATRSYTMTVAAPSSLVTFVQQPPAAAEDGTLFTVTVGVMDVTGAAVPGAQVTLSLLGARDGEYLGPDPAPTALTNAVGQATFANIFVRAGGTTYQLRALVNVVGSAPIYGDSNPFPVAMAEYVGPVGGSGGADFGRIVCPAGSVATAFRGRAGDDIDRTELWCSTVVDGVVTGSPVLAGSVGGATGGTPYDMSCSGAQAVTGIFGLAGVTTSGANAVDTLGITCSTPTTDPTRFGPVGVASATTTSFTLSCSTGRKVVGIAGRQGLFLDQVTIICQ